LFVIRIIS